MSDTSDTASQQMAKKKKRTKKRARTSSRKTPAKRTKTAAKKPTKKTAGGRAKSGRAASSVDSLLKKYAKERATLEAQLKTQQQKKQEVDQRIAKLRDQATQIAERQQAIESQLTGLDRQRDDEVKQLLSQLGVRLDATSSPPANASSDDRAASGSAGAGRDRVFSGKGNGRRD